MSFFLERSAQLYVSNVTSGWSSLNTDKIPLKQGFSYSIDKVVSSYLRENLDASKSRSPIYFSDKEPLVKFNFSTYINPTAVVSCSERYLWQGLSDTTGFIPGVSYLEIDFTNTNTGSSKQLTLWVAFENGHIYRLDNCIIEAAEIEGDIKSIGAINWTGTAQTITDLGLSSSNTPVHTIQNFDNCIINKLSTMDLTFNSTVYTIPLIDSNLRINNNINYVFRGKLGQISQLVGHYTTSREILGDFSGYLKIGSAGLLQDIYNLSSSLEDNKAQLTIYMGHSSNSHVRFIMPNVVLDIAEQEFTDSATIRIPFKAAESTNGTGDELTIRYYA